MGAHYSYLDTLRHLVPSEAVRDALADANWQKFTFALLFGGVVLGAGSMAASRIKTKEGLEKNIIPQGFSLTALFDLLIGGFLGYHDSILGKHNRKYASLSASVFFVILFSNLLGLVPGVPAVTTTVWINVGMALVVFVAFNWYGIKEQGLGHYLAHFAGPVWWLWWFMFPLEIFSTLLRVFTLNLRLYWNISADHLVLGIFSDLVPVIVPIVFYALGTFVAFMQAFVFTTLTMIYVFLAVDHGEEGAH